MAFAAGAEASPRRDFVLEFERDLGARPFERDAVRRVAPPRPAEVRASMRPLGGPRWRANACALRFTENQATLPLTRAVTRVQVVRLLSWQPTSAALPTCVWQGRPPRAQKILR